jgi:hypothetical protein
VQLLCTDCTDASRTDAHAISRYNSDYPTEGPQGASRLTTAFTLPLEGSAHPCPDDRPVRMEFCEWLPHQPAADGLCTHNTVRADDACFTTEGVFNVHKSPLDTG